MNNYYKPCTICKWHGKITLSIWKWARRRYWRKLQKFEQGIEGAEKPKDLIPHIDNCRKCNGTGLVISHSFLEVNNNYPHVAIIGGGIGWVALAVACLHRGIPYTLYERDSSFNSRSQWYGLTLQQASKAIEWLGILKLTTGLTSTRHVVFNTLWKIIWEWGIRKWLDVEILKTNKRRNIHISRQSLRSHLIDQLPEKNIISWWHCFRWINNSSNKNLELEFLVDENVLKTQADLIVWADGIRSRVRETLVDEEKSPLQYLGCIVMLGICSLESLWDLESEVLDSATVFQTVNGHERIYMMPFDSKNIMWQLSFPMDEDAAKILSKKWAEALKQEGLRRLWDWHKPIPEILTATNISNISGYPVYDRKILKPEQLEDVWNVTLLWDAMHPMSPFKWQGANQAILDALDLARGIFTKCGPDSWWREKWLRDIMLNDFEEKMIKRSSLKVRDSAKAVEMLHSDAVLHEWNEPRGRWIYYV